MSVVTRQPVRQGVSFVEPYPGPPRDYSDPQELSDMRGGVTKETGTWGALHGLEDLAKAERLHIQQDIRADIRAGCGKGNSYRIKDQHGTSILRVMEEENCMCRWLCGPARLMHLTVYNRHDEAVLHIDRACCRCDWCCCTPCCLCQHELTVRDARGDVIGTARQRFHVFHLRLDVSTEGAPAAFCQVRGPCCPCRCCTDINFDLTTVGGGHELGYISKRWKSPPNPTNTDHENVHVHMPHGLSIAQKASLLGATLLVNMMYFEMS